MEKNLKLVSVKAKNIGIHEHLEYDVNTNSITRFEGKNKTGKTTAMIKPIAFAILGKRNNPYWNNNLINQKAIENNENLEVELKISDGTIIERKTGKTDSIKIYNPETKQKFDTSYLDGMLNALSLDGNLFKNFTGKKLKEKLLDLANVDIAKEETELSFLLDERKDLGRDLKKITIKKLDKVEKVDLTEVTTKLQETSNLKNDLNSIDNEEIQITKKYESNQEMMKKILEENEKIEKRSLEIMKEKKSLISKINENKEFELKEKIKNAQEINEKAFEYEQNEKNKELKEKLDNELINAEQKINKIREVILAKLEEKLGGVGLAIIDDEVYHNGISSDNWSTAETEMIKKKVWDKLKPKLSLITIDDGNNIDSDNYKQLEEYAKKEGIEILMAFVADKFEIK